MIDETLHDLAVAYVLGELKGAEGIRFLTLLDSDPELRQAVRELEETLGEVALTVPRVAAPARVGVRLSKEIRSQKVIRLNFLPLGLAAAIVIGCALFAVERESQKAVEIAGWREKATAYETALAALREKSGVAERELASLQQKSATDERALASLRAKEAAAESALASLQQKDAGAEGEIRRLTDLAEGYRKKSDISEMKIATLSAQVKSYASALAVVVWDAGKQEGLVKLDKLPKLPAGKDYQLWVLDPSYKQPVSAGVVAADASGFARTVFKPAQEIHGADHFAVSIEKAGGSVAPQGQIVLVGQ